MIAQDDRVAFSSQPDWYYHNRTLKFCTFVHEQTKTTISYVPQLDDPSMLGDTPTVVSAQMYLKLCDTIVRPVYVGR